MKGLIFAAGIGSRLRPFTDMHPKALVEVGGKPMLHHVINRMIEAGITDIVVNVHHFPEQIRDFLSTHQFDANIYISDESDMLLDTGGGILKALPLFDGDDIVLAHNADILSDINFKSLQHTHLITDADVTLAVQPHRQSSRMLYARNGQLAGWQNLSTGATKPVGFIPSDEMPCAFAGIHIFNPNRIGPLLEDYASSNGRSFSIIPFYLSALHRINITTHNIESSAIWHDIGRPDTLQAARNHYSQIHHSLPDL